VQNGFKKFVKTRYTFPGHVFYQKDVIFLLEKMEVKLKTNKKNKPAINYFLDALSLCIRNFL